MVWKISLLLIIILEKAPSWLIKIFVEGKEIALVISLASAYKIDTLSLVANVQG